MEDRIRRLAKNEARKALGVTPEVTINKELSALEFIRDSPTKLLKRKNLYDEFGEDFIEGLHTKGYITHILAPDTFLITIKGRAYIDKIAREEAREALAVTSEVAKLTADIWNRMTPIEKDRLWVEAKLSTEEPGRRWIELWPEEKRALIRVFRR